MCSLWFSITKESTTAIMAPAGKALVECRLS
jgi:hypothetical protein